MARRPPGARARRRIQRGLALRDGMLCFYCTKAVVWASELGGEIQPDTDPRPIATIDHVKPRSEGGSNHLTNLIIACRPCHNLRHG